MRIIQVKENFSSGDLLGWLPEALVVDGVVSASIRTAFSAVVMKPL